MPEARSILGCILVAPWFTLNNILVTIGTLLLDFWFLPCRTPGARSPILPVSYLVLKWSPPPVSIQSCRRSPRRYNGTQNRPSGAKVASELFPPSFQTAVLFCLMHFGRPLAHFWHQFDSNEHQNATQNQYLAQIYEQNINRKSSGTPRGHILDDGWIQKNKNLPGSAKTCQGLDWLHLR